MGDDIKKQIIRPGVGSTAIMGTVVLCSFKGFFLSPSSSDGLMQEDGGELDVHAKEEPFEEWRKQRFQIGESDTIPGLELSLRHARVNEIFRVKISSKFAYGSGGRVAISAVSSGEHMTQICVIPPNSDLEYEVEVIEHEGVFGSKNNNNNNQSVLKSAALEEVLLRKECGNRWFSFQDYAKAGRAYSKGTQVAQSYLNSGAGGEGEDVGEKELVESMIACLNNLSACYISTGDNFKAKEVCTRVLEMDSSNVKALLRAARSSLVLHDYEECEVCLNRVLEIEPDNLLAPKELQKLKKAKDEYRKSSNNMAKKMATKLFPNLSVPSKTAASLVCDETTAKDNETDSKTKTRQLGEDMQVKQEQEQNVTEGKRSSVEKDESHLAPFHSPVKSDESPHTRAAPLSSSSNLVFVFLSVLVLVLSLLVGFYKF